MCGPSMVICHRCVVFRKFVHVCVCVCVCVCACVVCVCRSCACICASEEMAKRWCSCFFKFIASHALTCFNTTRVHFCCGLLQGERSRVLHDFKSGTVPLMIATDVAARGLDVPDVEYVLNYTFPLTIEDYVHRIGRTGRAGAKGTAHTFFTLHDKSHAGALGNILRGAGVEVPAELMKFGQHTKRKVHPVYGAHYRQTDDLDDAEPTRITFDSDSD